MHENVYMEQGLEKSWETHRKCAEMLWEGAENLGLELLVQDKVCEGNRTILMFRKINSDSSALQEICMFIVFYSCIQKLYQYIFLYYLGQQTAMCDRHQSSRGG